MNYEEEIQKREKEIISLKDKIKQQSLSAFKHIVGKFFCYGTTEIWKVQKIIKVNTDGSILIECIYIVVNGEFTQIVNNYKMNLTMAKIANYEVYEVQFLAKFEEAINIIKNS